MYTADIDRTHIIALQEVDGMLWNMELPITRPEQFIVELRAMNENPTPVVRVSKVNTHIFDLNSFLEILSGSLLRLDEVNQAKQVA